MAVKTVGRAPAYGIVLDAQIESDVEVTYAFDVTPSDLIVGTPGDDSLRGTDGDDTIDGGAGNDTMRGGKGYDTYHVDSTGDVIVEVGSVNRVIASISYTLGKHTTNLELTGSADIDGTGNFEWNSIIGNAGANVLRGMGGNDGLNGGAGDDALYGGPGDDGLAGDSGNDTLDGGSCDDGDDLWGGEGNDQLTIAEGHCYGGSGNDTLVSTTDYSWLYGESGDDHITARSGGWLDGGDGDDSLQGSKLGERLDGGIGNDLLEAGAGNDWLTFSGGRDTLKGGTGLDWLDADFRDLTTAITWRYAPDAVQFIDGSRITGIEGLYIRHGGAGNDTIDNSGGDTDDSIRGGAGDDALTGGGGKDTLLGEDGNDTLIGRGRLSGENGNDQLYGSDSADELSDGLGNDLVVAGAGGDTLGNIGSDSDTLHGGKGIDTLSADWTDATEGIVWINDPTQAQLVNGKTISGFEVMSVSAGSGNDLLGVGGGLSGRFSGRDGNDTLLGGGQNDFLTGGVGDDSLIGDAGADSLWGGNGADLFVCGDPSAADYVVDFFRATDKLAIAQSAYAVGDGDSAVEGAITIGGPGGFAASAELVVNTQDISDPFTAENAATAMGSATGAYAVGQTAIFVLDNGNKTAIYGFESAGTDAVVSAAELTLLCTMEAVGGTAVGDYLFVG